MKRFKVFGLFALLFLILMTPIFAAPVQQVDFSPGYGILPAQLITMNANQIIQSTIIPATSPGILGERCVLLDFDAATARGISSLPNIFKPWDRFSTEAFRRYNTGEMVAAS